MPHFINMVIFFFIMCVRNRYIQKQSDVQKELYFNHYIVAVLQL